MKLVWLFLGAILPMAAPAQLTWVPSEPPAMVFSGLARQVAVTIRNPGDKPAQLPLRLRLFQLSSATAMPVGPAIPWKNLEVLAGQTTMETVSITIPEIKVGTRFQIHWLDDTNTVLGKTDLIAWPATLLQRLKELGGDQPFGVVDPDEQLKPLLSRLMISFEDLKDGLGWADFHGRFAIFGPFLGTNSIPAGLAAAMARAADKGLAVVWLEPPARTLFPETVRLTRVGSGAVLMAPGSTVASLADSARSQLALISYVQNVLAPGTFALPKTP